LHDPLADSKCVGTDLPRVDTFCLGEAFSSGQNSEKMIDLLVGRGPLSLAQEPTLASSFGLKHWSFGPCIAAATLS